MSRAGEGGNRKGAVHCLILGALLTLASGCGGGGGDSGDVGVTDLELQDSSLAVGESTVLVVDFSYDATDVFSDDANVALMVELPPEFSYVTGTAEIDSFAGDDRVGAEIITCPDSYYSYLLFDLNSWDLEGATNPGGDAVARLTLTVRARFEGALATIGARAQYFSLPSPCMITFRPDSEISGTVRPAGS